MLIELGSSGAPHPEQPDDPLARLHAPVGPRPRWPTPRRHQAPRSQPAGGRLGGAEPRLLGLQRRADGGRASRTAAARTADPSVLRTARRRGEPRVTSPLLTRILPWRSVAETDQQIAFRSPWSRSTRARVGVGSWARCQSRSVTLAISAL